MFEDRTFENIRDEMLAEFPADIDIREGSIAYDSVSAVAAKAAMLYVDIANCYELTNLEKSSGEYLDSFASEHGLKRINSTSAIYEFLYEGNDKYLESGMEFYDESGDYYFTLRSDDTENYILVSNETGTTQNTILSGTPAIPVSNIEGLTSSSFGRLITPGIDDETDDSLRSRIKDKISGPAENGNKSQYKSWCESIEGVGRAFIYPLKYGPNTVEAILISPDGLPVAESVVDKVQNYIDPKKPEHLITYNGKKVTLGSGYGDGVASIGAHFIAFSADEYGLNIQADIQLNSDYTIDQAKSEINSAVKSYLKELALEAEQSKTIRYSKIGSLIEQLGSVFDYFNLKINGESNNINIPDDSVAVLQEVDVSVVV